MTAGTIEKEIGDFLCKFAGSDHHWMAEEIVKRWLADRQSLKFEIETLRTTFKQGTDIVTKNIELEKRIRDLKVEIKEIKDDNEYAWRTVAAKEVMMEIDAKRIKDLEASTLTADEAREIIDNLNIEEQMVRDEIENCMYCKKMKKEHKSDTCKIHSLQYIRYRNQREIIIDTFAKKGVKLGEVKG
jgi:hypothetical protein